MPNLGEHASKRPKASSFTPSLQLLRYFLVLSKTPLQIRSMPSYKEITSSPISSSNYSQNCVIPRKHRSFGTKIAGRKNEFVQGKRFLDQRLPTAGASARWQPWIDNYNTLL